MTFSCVEISYQIWILYIGDSSLFMIKRLESPMYKCFKKRRIRSQKLLYTKDIRELISKKKSLKKLLKSSSIDMDTRVMLGSKIDKLEYKIDKAIVDFNSRFVMSSINQNGGTLDKQLCKLRLLKSSLLELRFWHQRAFNTSFHY